MLLTAFIAVSAAAAIGLAIMWIVLPYMVRKQWIYDDRRITWLEYAIAMGVTILVVIPSVLLLGEKLSIDNKLRYEEWRTGVELPTAIHERRCHPGSSGSSVSSGYSNCTHSYNTGERYSWDEPYQDCSPPDSRGNRSCTTKYRTEYGYIYAPYATAEYTYAINDSLGGRYEFPEVYLAQDPQPYHSGHAIPGNIPRGIPADWLDYKARLDAGDPRHVTRLFDYDNYILASQDKILAAFSLDVDRYLAQKILPDHTANILSDNPTYGNRPQANKCSFVGLNVGNEPAWQESQMRFNAALGSKYQGDLHCVFIDAKLVDDPQNYLKALRAYWLGEHFGKRALGKNGIILVAGVSDGKIVWAQADTGMPYGNNVMLDFMGKSLIGKTFEPDVVFGKPRTVVVPKTKTEKAKVSVTLSSPPGALEEVMFDKYPFKRPCMLCEDPEDEGGVGYKGLIDKIEPSTGQKSVMVLVVALLSIPSWCIVAVSSFIGRRKEDDYSTPTHQPFIYRR